MFLACLSVCALQTDQASAKEKADEESARLPQPRAVARVRPGTEPYPAHSGKGKRRKRPLSSQEVSSSEDSESDDGTLRRGIMVDRIVHRKRAADEGDVGTTAKRQRPSEGTGRSSKEEVAEKSERHGDDQLPRVASPQTATAKSSERAEADETNTHQAVDEMDKKVPTAVTALSSLLSEVSGQKRPTFQALKSMPSFKRAKTHEAAVVKTEKHDPNQPKGTPAEKDRSEHSRNDSGGQSRWNGSPRDNRGGRGHDRHHGDGGDWRERRRDQGHRGDRRDNWDRRQGRDQREEWERGEHWSQHDRDRRDGRYPNHGDQPAEPWRRPHHHDGHEQWRHRPHDSPHHPPWGGPPQHNRSEPWRGPHSHHLEQWHADQRTHSDQWHGDQRTQSAEWHPDQCTQFDQWHPDRHGPPEQSHPGHHTLHEQWHPDHHTQREQWHPDHSTHGPPPVTVQPSPRRLEHGNIHAGNWDGGQHEQRRGPDSGFVHGPGEVRHRSMLSPTPAMMTSSPHHRMMSPAPHHQPMMSSPTHRPMHPDTSPTDSHHVMTPPHHPETTQSVSTSRNMTASPSAVATPTTIASKSRRRLPSPVAPNVSDLLALNDNSYNPLPRQLWVRIFSHLPQSGLCVCMRVCRSFQRWAITPVLWPRIDLSRLKPIAAMVLGEVAKRKPRHLCLDWCGISRRQLVWLATRLSPQLSSFSAVGLPWSTLNVLAETHLPSSLRSIDLSWVDGLNDAAVRGVLHIAESPRPWKLLAGLRVLRLTDTQITDLFVEALALRAFCLRKLVISHCKLVTDTGLEALCGLTVVSQCTDTLEEIDLAGCTCITDRSVVALRRCLRLRRIDLRLCEGVSVSACARFAGNGNEFVVHEEKLMVKKS